MRQKRTFFALVLLVFALGVLLPQASVVNASAFLITPSSAAVGTSTDYCFGFTWPLTGATTGFAAGDYFSVDLFGLCTGGSNDGTTCKLDAQCTGGGTCALFDLSNLTISDTVDKSEVNFYPSNSDCTGGTIRQTEATETAADDRDLATISDSKLTLKFEDICSSTTNCTDGFSIKFTDTDVDVDTDTVITPGVAGNYQVAWTWGTGTVQDGMDADLMYVGAANEVNISGTVDPTLTLALGDWSSGVANTCPLGTLNPAIISTCSYSVTVTTNASSGFTSYIKGTDLASASHVLNPVGDTQVNVGAEEYGIATDATVSAGFFPIGVTCPATGGTTPVDSYYITSDDTNLSTVNGPSDNTSGKVTVCHAASISGTTPAGLYSQVVTITASASF